MRKNYTSNYIRIYLWQGISLVLGFLSLFIVIPKLTSMPVIYGIYSICMSVTMFFIYADIGFIGAGYKYASEKFAINNLNEEIRIVGFISFILFLAVLLFSAITFIFAVNPHILIKGLNNPAEAAVASKLLFILALFSPIIILQRLCQVVFGIRLEDYIYQRFSILVNLARIISVFYFFRGSRYDIVGYFIFFQAAGLASNILYLFIIKNRYHYDLRLLARSFRFSTDIYNQTKKLALGSFSITIVFILYYELDLFAIGKLLGAEQAGFYAVALTIMSFFRGLMGVIYGPFSARFNHFIGLKETDSLKSVFYSAIILTLPLIVFPIISMTALMKPLIFCWVGNNYASSVMVAQFLIMSFVYNFFVQPTAVLLTAQERIKELNIVTFIMAGLYWAGILSAIAFLGIRAFAISKFIVFTAAGLFYFTAASGFLRMKLLNFMKTIAKSLAFPVSFQLLMLFCLSRFLPAEKGKANLLIVIGSGGMSVLTATVLYYVSSRHFKDYVNGIMKKIFLKFQVT